MSKLLALLATGFGAGKFPVAPGTAGTVVAIPIVWLLTFVGPLDYMLVTVLLIAGAIFVADWYENHSKTHDAKEIVIDEIVGFLVTMVWIPFTWQSLAIGFLLFRVLDAVKPWPISVLDSKVKGGIGVVVDDLAAGIVANAVLQCLYSYTDVLGLRLVQ